MAVPKKKTSQSRKGMRRSHHGLASIHLSECSNCGAHKLPHHICPTCNFYKGRQVYKNKAEVVAE